MKNKKTPARARTLSRQCPQPLFPGFRSLFGFYVVLISERAIWTSLERFSGQEPFGVCFVFFMLLFGLRFPGFGGVFGFYLVLISEIVIWSSFGRFSGQEPF